jgi:hypothetical protein
VDRKIVLSFVCFVCLCVLCVCFCLFSLSLFLFSDCIIIGVSEICPNVWNFSLSVLCACCYDV